MIIFGYIMAPVKSTFFAIVEYIPNLFYIAVIYYSIKYLIKGVNFMANEIQNERLKIPGFYPDWAIPTYHIIRFLLYAFMIAMIYQYLPGSDKGVFQGISVFVGLIISLGSTAFIGNIIAGSVITYMRPFSIGDRIKLNETTGNVIEKSLFVTRIKTPKNEVVTIPNSFILSSQTTNFSVSAKNYGLIVHSDVSIGYEVPWQKAHECLLKAAKATNGTIKEKAPFVLDLGLENYYNLYQINVYISDANKIPVVITELNSRIQDIFLEEGIDIESPILISERGESAKH
jgi:small-conductance mechanosensitive channel